MRSYPTDEYDRKELELLNAEPWMADLLKLNPSYPYWGPGEDYMTSASSSSHGWAGAIHCATWADMTMTADELNVFPNFYFNVHRASTACVACGTRGYAPEARRLEDEFYDFERTGKRWCDAITLDEARALVAAGRLCDFFAEEPLRTPRAARERAARVDEAFVARVNRANGTSTRDVFRQHDVINRSILVRTRCEAQGYAVYCPVCSGRGTVFTEPAAHVQLVLWLLHPRKGASRGVVIQRIEQSDLPAVYEMLRTAAAQNAARFEKIPRPV